jgi:hypothetical protein
MRPSTSRRHRLPNAAKVSGSSLIEFSVAAIPVLLIGLGGIEAAQWFYIKQAISLALVQAGRAGIVEHANPQVIEAAFERALSPLYPPTAGRTSKQRMQAKFAQRSAKTGLPPWQIEIISPSAQAFQDFSDKQSLKGRQTGLAAINNSYQAEQDKRHRAKGWANGLGPRSGLSIHQANTLVLRVTYLHEPLLPGMRGLMRALSARTDSYASQSMARGGYLPITQRATLTMQSDPLDWPSPPSRKVIKAQAGPVAFMPYSVETCQGIWCLESGRLPVAPPTTKVDAANPGSGSPPASADPPANQGPNAPPPVHAPSPEPSVALDDPACGITLCCAPA